MRKIIVFLITTIMITALLNPSYADTKATITIRGTHEIKNDESIRTGKHTFVLTNLSGDPMPEGSDGTIKKVTVSTGEDFDFGEIRFEKAGIYEYFVSREKIQSEDLEEDGSVFQVLVNVPRDGKATVTINKAGTSGKIDKIVFSDTYTHPAQDKNKPAIKRPVKTGDTTAWLIYLVTFLTASGALTMYFWLCFKRHTIKR